jgi:hypothetical protein
MAQKFFETIFRRRNLDVADIETALSSFKPIKPAKDITDFEYPPESSFYQKTSNAGLKD